MSQIDPRVSGRKRLMAASHLHIRILLHLLFFLNENGETTVIKPGDKLNIVHRNKLGNEAGELFRASITPSGGQVFIRSNKVLYCLGNAKTTAAK